MLWMRSSNLGSFTSMARTQSPDYDKRREGIVQQAAKLFAKHGFLGASVSELAKSCNTSKSLVYHYFPSKEDVLYGVMSSHLDDLVVISTEVMALPMLKPVDRLKRLTRDFMQAYVDAAPSHKVLLNELDNLPKDKRVEIIKRQREIVSAVESLLIEIRPDLTDASDLQWPLSMLFFGMINWTHTWFSAKGSLSADALAALAADIMLNGLLKLKVPAQAS
jgi:AcrR family transcriptional regulator